MRHGKARRFSLWKTIDDGIDGGLERDGNGLGDGDRTVFSGV
jgi:hypothetical protein